MKVLIDTNIILDVLYNRIEFYNNSSAIFKLCETKQVQGNIYALSIPNIVYIMRKELTNEKIINILNSFTTIFNIIDLKAEDFLNACELNFKDYEDALQSVCATRIKADYIITRNIKDYAESEVTAITPDDFLKRI